MHEKLLENVIESSYDGVFITDNNGIVLFVNKSYEKLAGRSREEYVGKSMDELMESGIMRTYISKDVAERKETVTAAEQLISGKNVLITGNPVFDEKGEVVAVVTNVRDISQIIRLEKEAAVSKELANLYQEKVFGDLHSDEIICAGELSKQLLEVAKKVALKDSTILITGQTGVGKEVIAKYIYSESPRKNNVYIKINCGSIPHSLLESELFGYVRGAFTGANTKGKLGIFELANEGTLFLDEIGELPFDMQASLLRVLQEGEITRIGDSKSRKVDVRIIAATNRNLEDMIQQGLFRRDLFYRLNVISITVPPLDCRKEDITPLAELFVKRLNDKYKSSKIITKNFANQLVERSWPGNIRELSNFVERQYIMQDGEFLDETITASMEIAAPKGKVGVSKKTEAEGAEQEMIDSKLPRLDEAVEKVEKELIFKAIKQGKTESEAAKLLGISQPTFSRKYRKYKQGR